MRIDDISVMLRQDVFLKHMQRPELYEQAKPKRILLWSMNPNERGAIYDPEQSLDLVRQMRLADDDTVRPSTPEWSVTGIRVSHALQTIIRFTVLPPMSAEDEKRAGKGKAPLNGATQESRKEMKISNPCKLSSCDCMIGNLQLPIYTKEDPITQASQRLTGHKSVCLCNVSAKAAEEEMEKLYGADMQSLGAASHFGSVTRGRNEQWKDDEQYGRDLEDDLRSRSRSRSPWPGRSPSATPTASRPQSRSQSRAPSRPPSRSGMSMQEHYVGGGRTMV